MKENLKNWVRIVSGILSRQRPLYVHYGITHACNLRCRMCSVVQGNESGDGLSLPEIDRIFTFLRKSGVVYVSIGGGEPFLRSDLEEVIALLIRKGFWVRLLTNGFAVTEGRVRKLFAAGLREVSVSLHSLDPEKQSFITGTPRALEGALEAIEIFSRIFAARSRLLLINTVVSPLNIRELPELVPFAASKGFHISFIPVESGGSPEFVFSEADRQYIDPSYDFLIRAKSGKASNILNSRLFLEKSRELLKTGVHGWECDAGRLYFSLDPRGGLSICHRFPADKRLLEENGFLRSKVFEKERRVLVAGCPGCLRPCWAEVSFALRSRASFWEMALLKARSLLAR